MLIQFREHDEEFFYTRYFTPLVYALVREEKYLYVGSSIVGIRRPFDATHHKLSKRRILDTDKMRIWRFATEEAAKKFESLMIDHYKPEWNGGHKTDFSSPKRKIQLENARSLAAESLKKYGLQ